MSIRNFLFILFLGFISMSFMQNCQNEINSAEKRAIGKDINNENTVIAFDLHEVIFEKVHYEMAMHLLKATVRGALIYLFNPFFWHHERKIASETIIWEDYFTKLKNKYPSLGRFDNEFYAAANAQKPVKMMIDLIASLHSKGYKLYVLSNIGGQTFEHFKKKFPEIFKYFSGSYTPDNNNNYICKPNALFYKNFKQYLKANNKQIKYCFFIDDLEKNIKAANDSNTDILTDVLANNTQCHIFGIRYTDIENLKKTFINKGII